MKVITKLVNKLLRARDLEVGQMAGRIARAFSMHSTRMDQLQARIAKLEAMAARFDPPMDEEPRGPALHVVGIPGPFTKEKVAEAIKREFPDAVHSNTGFLARVDGEIRKVEAKVEGAVAKVERALDGPPGDGHG